MNATDNIYYEGAPAYFSDVNLFYKYFIVIRVFMSL